MKTSKELFERLQKDEEFSKEYNEAIIAKREAGATSYYETFIPAANEFGYELSKEEVDAIIESQSEVLSEEELGKVSGGTSCMIASVFLTITYTIETIAVGTGYIVKKTTE